MIRKTKKDFFLFLVSLFLISSCGKLPDLPKSTGTPSSQTAQSAPQVSKLIAGPYAPGSYFKIQSEVDSAKDTRIYEFNYKNDGTFSFMQKSFPAGNLSSGFFHKSEGTFAEDTKTGIVTHTLTYDSCNDLKPRTVTFVGDPSDIINVTVDGNKISLYSRLSWNMPKSIADAMGPVVEDVGCTKF